MRGGKTLAVIAFAALLQNTAIGSELPAVNCHAEKTCHPEALAEGSQDLTQVHSEEILRVAQNDMLDCRLGILAQQEQIPDQVRNDMLVEPAEYRHSEGFSPKESSLNSSQNLSDGNNLQISVTDKSAGLLRPLPKQLSIVSVGRALAMTKSRHSEGFSPKNLTTRQNGSTLRSFAVAQDDDSIGASALNPSPQPSPARGEGANGIMTGGAAGIDEAMANKPIDTPTLDYLKANNIQIPQTDGYDSTTKTFKEGTPITSPESAYTMTEVNAAGENIITKYETVDVTRYYDKTTGAPVADEDRVDGVEYKVVQEKDLVPHYYRIDLKTTTYGEGDSSETFTWVENSSGDKTFVEITKEGDKYYTLTTDNWNNVTKTEVTPSTIITAKWNALDKQSRISASSDFSSTVNITGDFIGNTVSYDSGGAIYNYAYNGTATIGNLTGTFIGNTASYGSGGAIYNSTFQGTATIGNLIGDFIGNAASFGGAIYNYSNDKGIAIIGNLIGDFIGNTAQSGGGIYNYAYKGTATIGNIAGDFIGNTASYDSGGAIYNSTYKGTATIENITGDFIGNTASSGHGGAIHNYAHKGDATIKNLTGDFIENTASSGGAIYNSSFQGTATIENITGDFIGNTASSGHGGAIYNEGDIEQIKNSSFLNNYAISESGKNKGGAIYTTTDLDIIAKDGYQSVFSGNYTRISPQIINIYTETWVNPDDPKDTYNVYYDDKYHLLSDNETLQNTITNREKVFFKVTDNGTYICESADYYNTRKAQEETNGYTINPEETYKEYIADNFIYTKDDNAIYVADSNATLTFDMQNGGSVVLQDNIDGVTTETTVTNDDGTETTTVEAYNVAIKGDDINNTTFYLQNDIRNADVTFDNTTINTINNSVYVYDFNSLTLNSDTNMVADVDLENQTMDRFTANSYGEHKGNLNVVGMNLLSDAPQDRKLTEIYFAQPGLKDNVVNGIANNGELPQSDYQTTFYTPIYKYNVAYDNRTDGGYFMFAKGDQIIVPPSGKDDNGGTSGGISGGGSGATTHPTGNPSDAFNPAVLASPVAAQAGATSSMQQVYNYSFQNADNFMNIPYLERVAVKNANKYALSPTGDATDVGTFSPLFTERNSNSVWVKPYAGFENIPLKNGPKVSNITYGTLVGFDTAMESTKHGWDRVWTGYIGYNGASQRYSGVDSTQNGGLLGATLTMYKGNFFNATTVSTGASVASNDTMYGHENFTMLMAGIGNKTGYNFEFKDGRFIIQPNLLLSYTFVNTFDYTNAAGVRINSDPLHAMQIAPGVKFIGNFKGGWQPYVGVNMVWNLLDKSDVTANSVKLPEMSIKPYVQYGVGLQKRFKDDKCMAFGQAMIQNGGRNGISLSAGFRWALGRDGKKIDHSNEKVSLPAPKITLNGGKAAVGVETGTMAMNDGNVGQVCPTDNVAGYRHPELDSGSINIDSGQSAGLLRAKALAMTKSRHSEGGSPKNLSTRQNDSTLRSFANVQDNMNTPSLEGRLGRVTTREEQTAQGERKILKQMTVRQKAAYNRKYNNTTITSKSAVIKQM